MQELYIFLNLNPKKNMILVSQKNSQAYEVALCIPFLYFKIILVRTEMNT